MISSVLHKHVVGHCVRALSNPCIKKHYNGDEDGMTTKNRVSSKWSVIHPNQKGQNWIV